MDGKMRRVHKVGVAISNYSAEISATQLHCGRT